MWRQGKRLKHALIQTGFRCFESRSMQKGWSTVKPSKRQPALQFCLILKNSLTELVLSQPKSLTKVNVVQWKIWPCYSLSQHASSDSEVTKCQNQFRFCFNLLETLAGALLWVCLPESILVITGLIRTCIMPVRTWVPPRCDQTSSLISNSIMGLCHKNLSEGSTGSVSLARDTFKHSSGPAVSI